MKYKVNKNEIMLENKANKYQEGCASISRINFVHKAVMVVCVPSLWYCVYMEI